MTVIGDWEHSYMLCLRERDAARKEVAALRAELDRAYVTIGKLACGEPGAELILASIRDSIKETGL